MIAAASAEYATLTLANDDVNGLYDLLFLFDKEFPDDLVEERLRAAKQALRNLVARGWLRLWFATWTSPDREEPIAPDALEAVIDPYWWQNHIDRMVWFAATEPGTTAFRRREQDLHDELSRPPDNASL
jgi:hypothetical protein